jgi:2-keto-4-pentenoate hydratase/2-oxohepta-3-ene-1,7-dioic acid hydratase in catechol pathway
VRIIRFLDDDNKRHWGVREGHQARILTADPCAGRPTVGDRIISIRGVLAPTEPINVFCIGKNYAGHVAETKSEVPSHPVIFMKPTTAVIGPEEAIRFPVVCRGVPQVDFEGELAVVIGRTARHVPEAEALDYVLSHACTNDASARWWQ